MIYISVLTVFHHTQLNPKRRPRIELSGRYRAGWKVGPLTSRLSVENQCLLGSLANFAGVYPKFPYCLVVGGKHVTFLLIVV